MKARSSGAIAYAIKVLLPELSAHKEIVQRFFNEAKAVTQVPDPGIVQVFDLGYDQTGSAFIVMGSSRASRWIAASSESAGSRRPMACA